jgi:DNA-binding transcriptional ArsR family regulator
LRRALQLESVLSSYGRVKVLKLMIEEEELNISEVARRTGLSHASTARHLGFLTKSGVLREKRFNRIRIFSVERGSPYYGPLSRLIEEWKEAGALYAEPQRLRADSFSTNAA